MEEGKKIYEVSVRCMATYTALVKAGTAQEAMKEAEELAMDASPIEFDIGSSVGCEIVRSTPAPEPLKGT